jgi:hypothetical protein
MVQNSGETLCSGSFKPVNLPESIIVEESPTGEPGAIKTVRWQAVTAIEDIWRVDDEWWRSEAVSRLYYAIHFSSGRRLIIYKNLLTGQWYRQDY